MSTYSPWYKWEKLPNLLAPPRLAQIFLQRVVLPEPKSPSIITIQPGSNIFESFAPAAAVASKSGKSHLIVIMSKIK
jgi:hypothetical protein